VVAGEGRGSVAVVERAGEMDTEVAEKEGRGVLVAEGGVIAAVTEEGGMEGSLVAR